MKILFIGGTGVISSACARLAIERGFDVYLLLRGEGERTRPVPTGAQVLRGDIRDAQTAEYALGQHTFDAIVDFVAFVPEHIETALTLFRARTNQYVFISSASAYKKPVVSLPITESTPLHNPFWEYSRNKIACEQRLLHAYRADGFPMTIVRPSHTYDQTLLPFEAGGTVLARIEQGKPVIVHGDGTSLWTLTHNEDFAIGLIGLLGHPAALGEAFHITSQESLPWNEIYLAIARALGKPVDLVHVPSDVIAREHEEWGAGLLGDKAHSVLFDNTKIKRLVPDFHPVIPFWQGAREIVAYHHRNPHLTRVDPVMDALMDRLVERFR
jgi:nucleoside-diphosphate-sugar epimerase